MYNFHVDSRAMLGQFRGTQKRHPPRRTRSAEVSRGASSRANLRVPHPAWCTGRSARQWHCDGTVLKI